MHFKILVNVTDTIVVSLILHKADTTVVLRLQVDNSVNSVLKKRQ